VDSVTVAVSMVKGAVGLNVDWSKLAGIIAVPAHGVVKPASL
jgi:hypothetical protein